MMKVMMRSMCVLFLLTAVVIAKPATASRMIVEDGKPNAVIVIRQDPPRMTKLAAEELQAYLLRISGAKLEIATTPGPAVNIYVGRSDFTDKLGLSTEGLDFGGYRMVSGENWLALLGQDSDFTPPRPFKSKPAEGDQVQSQWNAITGEAFNYPHHQLWKRQGHGLWQHDEGGSFQAVTAYLQMLGVRWYLPDELGTIVPDKPSIPLPALDRTHRPTFAMRQVNSFRNFAFSSREEVLWQLRMGFNDAQGTFGYARIAHGIYDVIARPEMREAHHEYLALFNGQRDVKYLRECLSSQGLFEANVRYLRDVFDTYEDPALSVMPADGYSSVCECDLCKGKDTPERGWHGSMSDYVWGYVNRVAVELYKTHPEKKIFCLAYGTYTLPPESIQKLSPNLVVGIYQTRRDFYDNGQRKFIMDVRKAWQKLLSESNNKLWQYEYYLDATPTRTNANMPVFYPRLIAQDIQSLKDISLGEHIDLHRNKQESLSDLAVNHLNLYVTAQYWLDADQDIDAMLEEYYTLYYGPARDTMKAFVEYCENNWMKLRQEPERIDHVLALISRAQSQVPADSVYARRLQLIADYIHPLHDLRKQLAKARKDTPVTNMRVRPGADITLVGKLDEPVWDDLPPYVLRDLKTGEQPISWTRFHTFWSDGALYFGIEMHDRDMDTLQLKDISHDSPAIWDGDCVEILLETPAHSYYQITVSPTGVIADLDRGQTGVKMDWSSQAQVGVHRHERGWTLEIRIPGAGENQADIDRRTGVAGGMPTDDRPWYYNICRQHVRGDVRTLSAYSPTQTDGFHEPSKFAKLKQ